MIKSKNISVIVALLLTIFLVACGGSKSSESPPSADDLMRPSTPPDYQGITNPLEDDASAADEGRKLFLANCASCHGNQGQGDGASAKALDPPPTNLAFVQSNQEDGYLYWRIAEGGLSDPFRSSMPAWKNIFSEEQIWKVVSYIRTMEN